MTSAASDPRELLKSSTVEAEISGAHAEHQNEKNGAKRAETAERGAAKEGSARRNLHADLPKLCAARRSTASWIFFSRASKRSSAAASFVFFVVQRPPGVERRRALSVPVAGLQKGAGADLEVLQLGP